MIRDTLTIEGGNGGNDFGLDDISFIGPDPHFLQIYNAVELVWFAASGTTYQVQSTTDLASTNWLNVGYPFTSDNTTNSVLYSTRGTTNKYYRLEEVE